MVFTDKSKLPQHVAIIMDGNGRWAQKRKLERVEGHRVGVRVSENIITYAREIGIGYLTLYAFSKENWERPKEEVEALMKLLKAFLLEKEKKMKDNGIRLNAIGDTSLLPREVQEVLKSVIDRTKDGKQMVLTLALSYGSRDEILRGVTRLANEAVKGGEEISKISEEEFSGYLDTKDMPDPDLIIRTSGENRISNFMLWQGAYSEFVFEKCHWPDFTPEHFLKAIKEYQRRERRYGRIGK